jgi:hypothetical protein
MVGKAAMTLSGSFMDSACRAYFRCIQDRETGKVFVTDDNNYSDNALDALILSVTALEAFINEVTLGPTAMMLNKKMEIIGEWVGKLDVRTKYHVVPYLLWGNTFNRGSQPYQDFRTLVNIRNELVHYKMKPYECGDMPECVMPLLQRGILLTPANAKVRCLWVSDISCSKTALWAHNTACRMANSLIEMADDENRNLWGDGKRFSEIPEEYWKALLARK